MTNANNNQDQSNHGPLALSWDTLPELAKSRWEEAVAFDVTIENQLTKAKADRSLAEMERQKIAKEILEATKEVCEEILNEGKRALERARSMEAEASGNLGDSKDELLHARAIKAEAEEYREKLVEEAQHKCAELKDQSVQEAKRILGQAEIMRASVMEELEAQKIYTEAARLKADSHEVLTKIREMRGQPVVASTDHPEPHPSDAETIEMQSADVEREAPIATEATSPEDDFAVDTKVTENGKKSGRHPSPAK